MLPITRREIVSGVGVAAFERTGGPDTGPSGMAALTVPRTLQSEIYLMPKAYDIVVPNFGRMRAYEVGPEDVPVVVAIPGTSGRGLMHVAWYLACAPIYCRLLTFDREGSGTLPLNPNRKVRDTVGLVKALLDQRKIETASVYGHSAGGPSALAAAALLPERIHRVASLAGIGPNFGPGGFDYVRGSSPAAMLEIQAARKGRTGSLNYLEDYKKLAPDSPARRWDSDNDLRLTALFAPILKRLNKQFQSLPIISRNADAYANETSTWVRNWGFDLSEVGRPTKFYHGTDDLQVSPNHSRWLSSRIRGSSVEYFPHFGHNLSQMMPDFTAWLIER